MATRRRGGGTRRRPVRAVSDGRGRSRGHRSRGGDRCSSWSAAWPGTHMMSFFPDGVGNWPDLAWAWFARVVLVPDTLVQLVAVLVAGGVVWLLAGATGRGLERGLDHLPP